MSRDCKVKCRFSIKGDTIVYNADSFKTGTERKLEDVLGFLVLRSMPMAK
jgi:hypothetical protein